MTFRIQPDRIDAFLARVAQQANDSLEETGCRRFDVWQDPADRSQVFLYEIYDDRAAFDDHLASAHFKVFDAEVAPCVAGKVVETGALSPG